jgi:hypothetical protein
MARHALAPVLAWALAALAVAGCNLTEPVGGDADADREEGGDSLADAEAEPDADAEAAWTPGPVTLIVREMTFLTERVCDVDGDGDPDNAIADLGSPQSDLFAMGVTALVSGSLGEGFLRLLLHFPRLDSSPAATDGEVTAIVLEGDDTDWPRDWSDDYSGDEPFYVRAQSMDPCGEPLSLWRDARIEAGRFVSPGASLAFDVHGAAVTLRGGVNGELAPDGRSAELQACGSLRCAELGAAVGDGLTLLEALVGGGAIFGLTGEGIDPDLDLDGDGLERFALDDHGQLATCVDGDGTVIPGRDCYLDTRIADGISLSIGVAMTSARLAGREPSWPLMVPGRCDGGMPEESLWGWLEHRGACVGVGESCDPLVATPCCDGRLVCAGEPNRPYRCSGRCTPTPCDYGGGPGVCSPYGARGDPESRVCQPVDNDVAAAACELDAAGCTTEYGIDTSTSCTEIYGRARLVCLDECFEGATGCTYPLRCFPLLTEEGGVCYEAEE